jgi:hypothetical protein
MIQLFYARGKYPLYPLSRDWLSSIVGTEAVLLEVFTMCPFVNDNTCI